MRIGSSHSYVGLCDLGTDSKDSYSKILTPESYFLDSYSYSLIPRFLFLDSYS